MVLRVLTLDLDGCCDNVLFIVAILLHCGLTAFPFWATGPDYLLSRSRFDWLVLRDAQIPSIDAKLNYI